MRAPISDGVSGRLCEYLTALGQYLGDCRKRVSFSMYVLGLLSELRRKRVESISTLFVSEPDEADAAHQRLLHFLGAAPWPDDEVRRTAVRFALADLTQRAPLQSLTIDRSAAQAGAYSAVGDVCQQAGPSA